MNTTFKMSQKSDPVQSQHGWVDASKPLRLGVREFGLQGAAYTGSSCGTRRLRTPPEERRSNLLITGYPRSCATSADSLALA